MSTALRLSAASLAVLLALSSSAFAAPGEMESNYEQKLAKDFVKNAAWEMDWDAALKKAKESNKLIFAYFTRSYSP